MTTPRAEGGRGEVNLPPQSLLLGVLTRRTEGRRISNGRLGSRRLLKQHLLGFGAEAPHIVVVMTKQPALR